VKGFRFADGKHISALLENGRRGFHPAANLPGRGSPDWIATHTRAFEDDSKAAGFDSNLSKYESDRKSRLGEAAAQPHRIKYRPLTRQ